MRTAVVAPTLAFQTPWSLVRSGPVPVVARRLANAVLAVLERRRRGIDGAAALK